MDSFSVRRGGIIIIIKISLSPGGAGGEEVARTIQVCTYIDNLGPPKLQTPIFALDSLGMR